MMLLIGTLQGVDVIALVYAMSCQDCALSFVQQYCHDSTTHAQTENAVNASCTCFKGCMLNMVVGFGGNTVLSRILAFTCT
jgi:hypothetical protein